MVPNTEPCQGLNSVILRIFINCLIVFIFCHVRIAPSHPFWILLHPDGVKTKYGKIFHIISNNMSRSNNKFILPAPSLEPPYVLRLACRSPDHIEGHFRPPSGCTRLSVNPSSREGFAPISLQPRQDHGSLSSLGNADSVGAFWPLRFPLGLCVEQA